VQKYILTPWFCPSDKNNIDQAMAGLHSLQWVIKVDDILIRKLLPHV